jgi:glutamyl-Q tRNA(Asp) synthetase
LHFGSLVTAVGSYLQARCRDGEWHLRIDDIDPDRDSSTAVAEIPRQLEAFGLYWDGSIVHQSRNGVRHRDAIETLLRHGRAFHCGCSRRQITASARSGPEGSIYPGTCRAGLPPGKKPRSIRLRVDDTRVDLDDPLQGPVSSQLSEDVGDFVIRRADGCVAYQLAAAVDDAADGFTEVVRGADLLPSTLRQMWLHACLGLPSPAYMHLPVALDANGEKLSKQTRAAPLEPSRPGHQLVAVLRFLDQRPPAELAGAPPRAILDWAAAHWHPRRLRGILNKDASFFTPPPASGTMEKVQ